MLFRSDLWPLTRQHLQRLELSDVAGRLRDLGVPDADAQAFWNVARENINRLDDLAEWWSLCRDGTDPEIDPEDVEFVTRALTLLPPPPYGPDSWKDWTTRVRDATGRKGKALFMPLRKALTGRSHGPDMAALMPLLQKVPAPR